MGDFSTAVSEYGGKEEAAHVYTLSCCCSPLSGPKHLVTSRLARTESCDELENEQSQNSNFLDIWNGSKLDGREL